MPDRAPSRRSGVPFMIHFIRQRSAADGKPLDHLTDREIRRRYIGVEYIWPELEADTRAAMERLHEASDHLGTALTDAAIATEALAVALSNLPDA